MYGRIPLLGSLLLCLSAPYAHGQCTVDPFDNVLCVYPLSATEEVQYTDSDAQMSAFWKNWGHRDSAALLPPDDCYPGHCSFTDPSDGRMTVRAALSCLGLHLYMEVQDNVWVDSTGANGHSGDSVEFFLDAMDANTIFTCSDCLVGYLTTALTFTTFRFEISIGGDSLPGTFRLAYYNEQLWSWMTDTLSFDDGKRQYGLEAEVVHADQTHRTQEWLVPLGLFRLPPGTGLGNYRFAFSVGYNDTDGDSAQADRLRWPNGKDPLALDATEVNYWGDLLLPGSLGRGCPPAAHRSTGAQHRPTAGSSPKAVAHYDLCGRQFGSAGMEQAGGVIIGRLPTGGTTTRCTAPRSKRGYQRSLKRRGQ